MGTRNKRQKSPDVDALKEDERQYGRGPLSLEELDEQ
jgi:DNA ligase-4